jgi:hypothetical protein
LPEGSTRTGEGRTKADFNGVGPSRDSACRKCHIVSAQAPGRRPWHITPLAYYRTSGRELVPKTLIVGDATSTRS